MKTKHLIPVLPSQEVLLLADPHPSNVMIDLTRECDQNCRFCYQPMQGRSRQADKTRLGILLEALARWGVNEVLYLGGEPTLYPHLSWTLERGARLGLKQRLISNGRPIGESLFSMFRELNVEVGISIHGGCPDVHDKVTGRKGSFDRAVCTLNTLAKEKVSFWVQYSHIQGAAVSMPDVHSALSLRGLCPDMYDINRIIQYDHAEPDYIADKDSWWGFLASLTEMGNKGILIRVESVPYCWVRRRAAREGWSKERTEQLLSYFRPCWMGFTQWAFSEDCFPKLCPTAQAYPLPVGWLPTEQALRELWEAPFMQEFRKLSFLGVPCTIDGGNGLCPDFYACLGGCRSATGEVRRNIDPLRDAD